MGCGSAETLRDEKAGEGRHVLLELQLGQKKVALAAAGQARVMPSPEQ